MVVRFHEAVTCPVCKAATFPMLLEIQDANENATPRIPKRFVLECQRPVKGKPCGAVWYKNAERP